MSGRGDGVPGGERSPIGRDLLALAFCIILCLAVAGIGGAVTANSVATWYPTLQKPSFDPPDWLFAPVWTVLYVLMGFALWRIWRSAPTKARRTALMVFGAQLALNLAWSFLFFGMWEVDLALVDIALLLLAILITGILFGKIDRWAGLAFVPYFLWVSFATLLNASIWHLNQNL